ncbi:MAG TPA: Hsp20/alpha crystallin family protein [Acidobacteriota bacterium]|nr:Hsp20/alpha crystallin family protein [Acidobacteriota bacterium]
MRLVPTIRRTETPSRLWPETTRFFEDFFNDFPFGSSLLPTGDQWTPAVDVLEKDGNLILRAELPGIEEKQIELKLEGNVLTLKGERKMEKDEKKSNYHRVESFYGSFSRSFSLPDTIDRDNIKAEFKNGVLSVTIPQKPEVRPREIPVSVQ